MFTDPHVDGISVPLHHKLPASIERAVILLTDIIVDIIDLSVSVIKNVL